MPKTIRSTIRPLAQLSISLVATLLLAGGVGSASEGLGYGFAAMPEEGASGLIRMGARHYDAHTARFLQTDPLGAAADQLYAYGANNPYLYWDPSGLAPEGIDRRAGSSGEPSRQVPSQVDPALAERVQQGSVYARNLLFQLSRSYHPFFEASIDNIVGIRLSTLPGVDADYNVRSRFVTIRPEMLADISNSAQSATLFVHEAIHAAQRWVAPDGTPGSGSSDLLVNELVAYVVSIDAIGADAFQPGRSRSQRLSASELGLLTYLVEEQAYIERIEMAFSLSPRAIPKEYRGTTPLLKLQSLVKDLNVNQKVFGALPLDVRERVLAEMNR